MSIHPLSLLSQSQLAAFGYTSQLLNVWHKHPDGDRLAGAYIMSGSERRYNYHLFIECLAKIAKEDAQGVANAKV